MEEILIIENLSKYYGSQQVLSNINLKINKGDIYGILGISGAGKSTLIRCINGLERFDKGHIYFHGKEVIINREFRKKVSMIFQNFNLLEQKTVLKNVMLAGELFNDKNAKEKALNLLNKVGLINKINSYPSQLSGGEKQRVAIARALMNNPEILLCDEATSALDPKTTKSILNLLKELNHDLNLTIVIIAHQINIIEDICNRIAIIDHSTIVEDGTTYEIFLSPKNKITKNLIYSGHVNTKLNEDKLIKLIFNGQIDEPIITNIIQDCNILVSIVYADSKVVHSKIYGQIIFRLPYYKEDIEKLKKYLDIKNIPYEEVNNDEFTD